MRCYQLRLSGWCSLLWFHGTILPCYCYNLLYCVLQAAQQKQDSRQRESSRERERERDRDRDRERERERERERDRDREIAAQQAAHISALTAHHAMAAAAAAGLNLAAPLNLTSGMKATQEQLRQHQNLLQAHQAQLRAPPGLAFNPRAMFPFLPSLGKADLQRQYLLDMIPRSLPGGSSLWKTWLEEDE